MAGLKETHDSIDLPAMQAFVEERSQEDLHLEFKTVAAASLKPDDRKNLAKAISGFANSDGGIIVWGVDARKDESGVDAAVELVPIHNVAVTFSKMNSLTGQAATPIVDGVIHELVSRDDGSGFIKTYVPQSDSTPHMAKLGEDRYYKRAGDSFYRMEHFDLEDVFGRRPKPKLAPHVELRKAGSTSGPNGNTYDVEIVIGITNEGRGVALFPYAELFLSPRTKYKLRSIAPEGRFTHDYAAPRLPQNESRASGRFAGGSDDVIHIGQVFNIADVTVVLRSASDLLPDLSVQYRIAAAGIAPVDGNLTIPAQEIIATRPEFQ